MDKTLRVMRLYDPANKNYGAAIEGFTGKLLGYLEDAGELMVDVTAEGFVAAEEMHMKGARREASVPFRLYRDGVRSFRFMHGLERDEAVRLLVAFDTQPDSPGRFDDDMATILWRQNFRHLQVVSVDEIGVTRGGSGAKGESPGIASDLSNDLGKLLDSIKTSTLFGPGTADGEGPRPVAASELDLLEMKRLARSAGRTRDEGGDIEVSAEAAARLRAEAEGDGGFLRRAVDVIGHVFLVGPCTIAPGEQSSIMGQLLRELVAHGDVQGVIEVLDRIDGGATAGPQAVQDLLGTLLVQLGAEDCVELLLGAARSSPASDGGPYLWLLRRLPASSLRHVARLYPRLAAGPVKEAWHEVIAARASEEPSALFAYLEHAGGDRAVEVVRGVLAAGKVLGAAGLLRSLLAHKEERVRVDTVKVCSALTGNLRRSLVDLGLADPSFRVRLAAIRVVELSRDAGFLPLLEKRLGQCGESEEEPVRLVHAIAVIGGDAAAACLRKLLMPRRRWLFFGARRGPHWGRAAVMALTDVADAAVRGLLAEGAASFDRRFAEACRSSLDRIARRSGP